MWNGLLEEGSVRPLPHVELLAEGVHKKVKFFFELPDLLLGPCVGLPLALNEAEGGRDPLPEQRPFLFKPGLCLGSPFRRQLD